MDFLYELLSTPSVSGNEEKIARKIREKIAPHVDEIRTDAMGNLIAVRRCGRADAETFMLCAHMDEIGVMVNFVEENGYLRFVPMGGLTVFSLANMQMEFTNGVRGVVCIEEEVKLADLKLKNLYLDIGASSREQALERIDIGDVACVVNEPLKMGDRLVSKALDNKIGCAILCGVIEKLKDPLYDCVFVFSTQEELGLRGARTAAYSVEPDYAIAVDVTDSGDMIGSKNCPLKLGEGAAIKVKDSSVICHKSMINHLTYSAKENKIKYQMEVLKSGGTDAGAISASRAGVVTGGVSIPTRNIHTPTETIDLKDVDACVRLLCHALTTEFDKYQTEN
ncbi:M42 family metallopeptidase [Feifania hominis]|uniref:M20/M25/M40 family metallo-hydrolase n=1 Tax=Feifania hominis TaxID=2763660 RepID=A0A926HTA4_9FIRM|nr:M20/M25/M40 family metallo-hydrolase [Feifania hominis]MBC8535669.1 M20/M25/M40 family metallo-hydrolase [Feifania hominis]